MKGLNSAIYSIEKTVDILEKHSPDSIGHIENLKTQIERIKEGNNFTQRSALDHVIGQTHSKCLGEICMENVSWGSWGKTLDKMKSKCTKALEHLENEL